MADRDPKSAWEKLLPRVERVLGLAERELQARQPLAAADASVEPWAYRWRSRRLEPIASPDVYPLDGLIGVERSVERLRANAAAFVRGEPALDVLLYGERGTGKSSAVRGLLGEFGPKGLRIVEVRRDDLFDMPDLYAELRPRVEKMVLFCDDLSFEEGDASYKQLKAVLDGGLEARPANVILMATSNRRHLMPEYMSENLATRHVAEGELHPGEATEEKISLSDRFGLMLPFFAFDQDTYLRIVDHHAAQLGVDVPHDFLHARAIRFALDRGTRSGRTARQAVIAVAQDHAREAK